MRGLLAGLLLCAAAAIGAAAGPDLVDSATGMGFLRVAGGTYRMGDDAGVGRPNERPAHHVSVSDFYLGVTEVTVGQFRAFADATGYRTGPERAGWVLDIDASMSGWARREGISWRNPGFAQTDDHPVVWVNWEDASAFVRWLAERGGRPYRLPTEAEWEYAARSGGRAERWAGVPPGGDPDAHAWHAGNAGRRTHPVGTRRPNGLGLHDMSGNVWEWCLGGEEPYREAPGPLLDPLGASTGDFRVLRGGSWRVGPDVLRTTYRSAYRTDYAHSSIGFRVALPAPGRTARAD